MKWLKLGWNYLPKIGSDYKFTHAALPVPIYLENDKFRIFFSGRDKLNRSHAIFIDIENINNPVEVSKPKVVYSPGKPGYFDESGVNLCSYCSDNNYFYYLGWSLSKNVPFSNRIGVSRLNSRKDSVKRILKCPVLKVCEQEPISFGYPFVLKIGDHYKMWYDTIIKWSNKFPRSYTSEIRSATSSDGINWTKQINNIIPRNNDENSICRPCVIHEFGKFKMWYSVLKNGSYSIGYSESVDGNQWKRMDKNVGISISNRGWDSKEICYPYIFKHRGKKYMLYNGNGYGKSGFGLAVLD